MKVNVHDFHTEISLSGDDVKELCKPGEGADTCVWVLVGADGFECSYYNRPTALLERWVRGQTVAQRDGCERVKELDLNILYTKATTLEDILKGEAT